MKPWRDGQLVTVNGGGAERDGIVFHALSLAKVVVAVPDEEHGAVFETVAGTALTERRDPVDADRELRRLISRTPSGASGGQPGSQGTGAGRRAHTRGPMHRTTGK